MGQLFLLLFILIIGVSSSLYYWYYFWYEPDKLRRRLLRNMVKYPFLGFPFRRFGRWWVSTASYLWFGRIATSLIILGFVILGVLFLLVSSGLVR